MIQHHQRVSRDGSIWVAYCRREVASCCWRRIGRKRWWRNREPRRRLHLPWPRARNVRTKLRIYDTNWIGEGTVQIWVTISSLRPTTIRNAVSVSLQNWFSHPCSPKTLHFIKFSVWVQEYFFYELFFLFILNKIIVFFFFSLVSIFFNFTAKKSPWEDQENTWCWGRIH